jgi:aldehyde dehydrogenase (NAD+)
LEIRSRTGSRLPVQESIADKIPTKLQVRLKSLRIGDPLDKATDIGAINSQTQLDRMIKLLASGIHEGGKIYGANCILPAKGSYFQPTLFSNVSQSHCIALEEIFGPALSIFTFRTPEEAVKKVNSTFYGLSVDARTDKGSHILKMSTELTASIDNLIRPRPIDPPRASKAFTKSATTSKPKRPSIPSEPDSPLSDTLSGFNLRYA